MMTLIPSFQQLDIIRQSVDQYIQWLARAHCPTSQVRTAYTVPTVCTECTAMTDICAITHEPAQYKLVTESDN